MLDDFAILGQAKDINSGPVMVARPVLVTMEDDIVVFGDDLPEFNAFARIIARRRLEIVDEALLSVGDARIVLDVLRAGKFFHGLSRLALIEHQVVEGDHVSFVLVYRRHVHFSQVAALLPAGTKTYPRFAECADGKMSPRRIAVCRVGGYVLSMNLRTIAVAVLSLSLAACAAQPTPYQPRIEGTGYTEQQLDSQTWRVEFAGNTVTPRETVDNYLLYRAAEIMLFGGFDKFVVLEKEIERNVTYQGYGAYRPYFGFSRHRHLGYGYYGSYAPDRYYPRVSYAGYATIRVFKGGAVPGDTLVYDAQELVQQLGPRIRLPQPADG